MKLLLLPLFYIISIRFFFFFNSGKGGLIVALEKNEKEESEGY